MHTNQPLRVLAVQPDVELRRVIDTLAIARGGTLDEVRDWACVPTARSHDLVVGPACELAYDAIRVVRGEGSVPAVLLVADPLAELDRALVSLLRLGNVDVVRRPLDEAEVALRARRLVDEVSLAAPLPPDAEWVDASPKMREVLDVVRRIAPTDLDVLVVGETGTGKEVVAQAVHRLSLRARGPFVPVDCGAIPPPLLESQLFGHERGAFTGAAANQLGLFDAAHGGTFFLDEIAELPLLLQGKLLRVLQERRVRPVGAREEHPVDVRVVAASGQPLARRVAAGAFRADLCYRVNAVQIDLPPLRERRSDIAPLAARFLAQHRGGTQVVGFTAAALEALTAYDWPGNVRELRNVVRRALLMARGERVGLDDLPAPIAAARVAKSFRELRQAAQAAFERQYLLDALRHHRGDVDAAATEAGLSRATFYRLLKRRGLDPKTLRPDAKGCAPLDDAFSPARRP